VRIAISEPFELVADSEEEVAVLGDEVPDESSPERFVIQAAHNTKLGGRLIRTVTFRPYFAGHSLDELKGGRSVVVRGAAYPADASRPVEFIGEAFPLS
jgi:hypothetical protein